MPGKPALPTFSAIPGDDAESPLKVASVAQRMSGVHSSILAAYHGQILVWTGKVLQQEPGQLVVGVRSLKLVMVPDHQVGSFAPGDQITVRGVVERMDAGQRLVHLQANAQVTALAAAPR